MLTFSSAVHIHLAVQPVDLRLGFDGLAGLVQSRLRHDPLCGHLLKLPSLSPSRRG